MTNLSWKHFFLTSISERKFRMCTKNLVLTKKRSSRYKKAEGDELESTFSELVIESKVPKLAYTLSCWSFTAS